MANALCIQRLPRGLGENESSGQEVLHPVSLNPRQCDECDSRRVPHVSPQAHIIAALLLHVQLYSSQFKAADGGRSYAGRNRSLSLSAKPSEPNRLDA